MFLKSDLERPEVDFDRLLEHFWTHFGIFLEQQIDQQINRNISQKIGAKKEQQQNLCYHGTGSAII